jgi:acyl dehydratase
VALDRTAVGREGAPRERTWTSTDALLYALGVGAGLGDPLQELAFTTENSAGVEQAVLPTFGVLLAQAPATDLGSFDRAMLVHAEQAVRLHRVLPVSGTVRATARCVAIEDKGSGALVTTESSAVDEAGQPLVTSRSSVFIRGEGGFGGSRGPGDRWQRPDREPDAAMTLPTRPEQALLYRLSGDRNPLHSDPAFAARAGFDRPILHGLCTYGITGRALLACAMDGDVRRFRAMSGRFSAPVLPGDELTVRMWAGPTGGAEDGGREVLFQTLRGDGTVVLDRGRAEVGAPG